MKKAVLLRQRVPKDVDRITFNSFEEIDDMWMLLFYHMCNNLGVELKESWNWGGYRYHHLKDDFVERWMPSFGECGNIEPPDLIFARGGFKEYVQVMRRFPNAIKIYYGAGKRYDPVMADDFTPYDLVLVDTEEQKAALEEKKYRAELLIKPACEHVFYPASVAKRHDIVFIANAPQKKLKGHKWLFDKLAGTGLKIIQIGYRDEEVVRWAEERELRISFIGWVPRKNIPVWACGAKVGVVASTDYESCPRVIPEYLAMNLPIVVRSTTRVSERYVNKNTGRFASDDNFVEVVRDVVANYSKYSPFWYYWNFLSTSIAAKELAEIVHGI